jgi:hypothetical protein
MILTDRQIVWTPIVGKESVAVALSRNFAKACMAHTVDDPKQLAEGVWKIMGKTPPVEPSNFLDLHTGLLPKGFYAGRNGLWLTLDLFGSIEQGTRPLVYHGHNEDVSAWDRLWLLQAFAAWADAATALLEWR